MRSKVMRTMRSSSLVIEHVVVSSWVPGVARPQAQRRPFSSHPSFQTNHQGVERLSVRKDKTHQKRQRFSQQRRREAAKAVPNWLRRDPTWREETMQALQLNNKQIRGMTPSKNLYRDSLESFYDDVLYKDDDSEVKASLNHLVAAGFDDIDFWRKYRTRTSMQNRRAHISTTLVEWERDLEAYQRQADALREECKALSERMEQVELPPNDQYTKGMLEGALDSVFSLFRSTSPQVDDTRTKSVDRKEKSFRREHARKLSKLQDLERTMELMSHKRSKLQLEFESTQPQMTQQEHDRATVAIVKAKPGICQALAKHIRQRHAKILEQHQALDARTDLTRPHEWFLHARLDRRRIIFHGGPTNSGKTHAALERLREARTGMYLAPLRLLAAEVYERLTVAGVYCNMYTGQERREIPFATHGSATVEMASLVDEYDVVVIDEIQMIADKERGFAWTRALMGSRSKEIHVCGGLEALDVVKRIAASCGDDFECRTYERFTELQIGQRSLASGANQEAGIYKSVQKGDCVVAFSRDDIFAIKREIEKNTAHKCCIIYGSLPPQTRSEQARLFNDPESGYDVLVASDAIGMGLNLSIRRIIFNSMFKNDGTGIVRLDHSAVKQISGRAGRRNSPYPIGEVTCRDPQDMAHLRQCMTTEIKPIQRAGLVPTSKHIEVFSETLNTYGLGHGATNLHKILLQFNDLATVKTDFFLCRQTPMVFIAKKISSLQLSISDMYTLCMCPVAITSTKSIDVMKRFATKLASGEVPGCTHRMLPRSPRSFDDLSLLCGVFSELELFLWLQKKFPPANQMEEQAALARKEHVIKLIGEGLAMTEKLKLNHCYVARDRRIRKVWAASKGSGEEDSEVDGYWNEGIRDS